MKKILCLLLAITIASISIAQTQQGIVKTRGRVVNGQVVPGTRLTGATITLNFGNPLVSGDDGAFSFNVPTGKNYSLVTAKKQGYTLADPEYIHRTFAYSASNPFYVVLEDEAQRQADINAATRKVRRTLTAQLQAREDEIEALKEQNKLTEVEYQKRLQELYDNQSKSEQLVKEMAERYASTDYDQLDEFNRQVQMYIEEGELQKADSMIRSKGDIEKRVEEYHNVVAANQKARQQLEQSEAGAAKTYEDLSQDLFNKQTIALQQYKWDDALSYLKQRADLDTTNVETVWEYAYLCYKQRKFEDCERYYHMSLNSYICINDLQKVADCQNNLGSLYNDFSDYLSSEKYYMQALENRERLFSQNPDVYRADLAETQNNLGVLYFHLRDYRNSERFYKQALENREHLFNQNPDTYRAKLAKTLNDFGILCYHLHAYHSSVKYCMQALENYEQLFYQNSDAYRADLAMSQTNLGNLFYSSHDYENCKKYYLQAQENYVQLFNQNPDAYRVKLALILINLGNLYSDINENESSEKYYMQALENYEQLFKQNPDAYRLNLAIIQNNLGNLYSSIHNNERSKKYYLQALENFEQLFNQNPNAYRPYLAQCIGEISLEYANASDFTSAYTFIDKAIYLMQDNANFYDTKGEILLMQGKNEEALAMWKKVLELNPDFLKDYPDGTDLSNGLRKLGLIE